MVEEDNSMLVEEHVAEVENTFNNNDSNTITNNKNMVEKDNSMLVEEHVAEDTNLQLMPAKRKIMPLVIMTIQL